MCFMPVMILFLLLSLYQLKLFLSFVHPELVTQMSCEKRCPENFLKTHRETPAMESSP